MCGRCRCTLRSDDVPRACHLRDSSVRNVDLDRYRPSYNVSPGSYLPVLRRDSGTDGCNFAVHCMKWGLVPSFTKKDEKPDHFKMFNARSESVCEKAAFRRLVPNNRCLMAVEGFYEWKKDGSRKQPYYIHFKDGRPLVFAALYDSWKNVEGETLYTFTILTTDSSSALQWLHDRMPVILGDEVSISMWLNGSSDTKFSTMLKPYEKLDLAWYPVTPAMGKPSFDGPECIKEIPLKTEQPISKFFSKKGAGNAKEPIKPVKTSMDSLTNTDDQKPIKEETETQVATKPVSFTAKEGADMKSDKSTQLPLLDTKVQVKGDPEKRLHDLTTSTGDIGKTPITPIKKKAKVETGDDKQRTLRSYFGKS